MKMLFSTISLVLISIIGGLSLSSCGKDDIEINDNDTIVTNTTVNDVEVNGKVTGKVVATPSTVKNGDEIELEIGGTSIISVSVQLTINGKRFYPVVHYLIDGKEVTESSETEMSYKAKCAITGLAVGEHTVSVNITGSQEGANYENNVASTTITVVE